MESPNKFFQLAIATIMFMAITGSFADTVRQSSSYKEVITVDNEHFQTYRNRTGKWIVANELSSSLTTYLRQVGTSENEVKEINNLGRYSRIPLGSPVFVPYSNEYANKLFSEGKGRRILNTDARELLWPIGKDSVRNVSRIYISSKVGKRGKGMHNGIDIACPRNSPILATSDGEVVFVGDGGALGRHIVIRHSLNRIQTTYAHNSHNLVKKGDRVKKGQVIALAGATGNATGNHLHLEVRYNNIILNPEHFFTPPGAEYDSKVVMLEQSSLRKIR